MSFSRRAFLGSVCTSAAVAPLPAAETPLNIVFVLADDLGWSDLGVYGADLNETPNLDRFAQTAMRFTHAYAASPVCSPTRASILTGKHPARLGMTVWHEDAVNPPKDRRLLPARSEANLPLSERTLADVLHEGGYATGHVGKWHLGTSEYYPEAQGFDFNTGGTHWGAPATYHYPFRGQVRAEYRYVPGLPWAKPGDYLTDQLAGQARRAIDFWGNKPFFLNLWHHAPHTPIQGKEEDVRYFRAKLRPGNKQQQPAYAAMIRNLDENFGRLLDHIEKAGIAGRTVVIFASDNGGYIGPFEGKPIANNAPLRSGKGSLYEGGVRIPMLIRWPGVSKAGVCDSPVMSMDLFRTILDAAGLPSESGLDGYSLKPLLEDARATLPREDLFFHYPHYYHAPKTTPVSSVLSGDWKLIEFFEEDRYELYNLAKDPSETRDVFDSYPAKLAELKAKLKAWQTSVGARLPSPNPNYPE